MFRPTRFSELPDERNPEYEHAPHRIFAPGSTGRDPSPELIAQAFLQRRRAPKGELHEPRA